MCVIRINIYETVYEENRYLGRASSSENDSKQWKIIYYCEQRQKQQHEDEDEKGIIYYHSRLI